MASLKTLVASICNVAFFLVVCASTASAGPAYVVSNITAFELTNPPFTLGFQFSTNRDITVTDLGFFDSGQDGLGESHAIGIWNSAGTLLTSSTVPAGTAGTLVNQFRYVSIAPIVLDGGGLFRIGALYATGVDPVIFPGEATDFATDPAVNFLAATFASGNALSDPADTAASLPGYFGPNFLFSTAASVPEPATLGLLGLGLLGLGFIRRKRCAS